MKKDFSFAIGLIMAVLWLSCSTKKGEQSTSASHDPKVWPEMESFHMVMAQAYHPYRDDKNLEPVKSLAENLAKESEKWATAALPGKVNSEQVKAKLEKLRIESRKLADLVKSGATDEQIADALSALHERFHTIMEEWQGGHGEKREEH